MFAHRKSLIKYGSPHLKFTSCISARLSVRCTLVLSIPTHTTITCYLKTSSFRISEMETPSF